MASAELRISEPVRVFLSDAWRLHMEAVAGRRFSFLYPDNSVCASYITMLCGPSTLIKALLLSGRKLYRGTYVGL